MKRSGILALWLILSLVSVVTSGCGYRVAATIQANAEATPVPTKLSWAAVPGPALSASAPETLSGLQTVSVPLATALSLYNWKWLSNPDQAAEADVLVRIWWMTDGPQYITERADPFYRPGLSFGTGIGFGSSPWHRGPFGYARQAFYVPEPSIQAIYSRVLVVEALRADALPKATLEALLPAAKPSGIASKPAPDMVRAALDQLHAAPEETLYVGDSEVDVATARNAGLDMIGVAWGFRGRAALEAAGAPLVADTPEQLLDMLQ